MTAPHRIRQADQHHMSPQWAAAPLCTTDDSLRVAFAAITSGVVIRDSAGTPVYANAAALQILGLTLEQLQGLASSETLWRLTREDGSPLPAAEQPGSVAVRTAQPQRDVLVGVALPDGAQRWLQADAVPLCD